MIKISLILNGLALSFCLIFYLYSRSHMPAVRPNLEGKPTRAEILDAATKAAGALEKMSKPSGEFVYRYNLNPNASVTEKYNYVRHAGTVYSLCRYYDQFPSPALREKILRSCRFLLKRRAEPPRDPNVILIQDRNRGRATLGASALGLVALLSAERLFPSSIEHSDLRKLGRFILSMQAPSGAFHSGFDLKDGPSDKFYSLYYPGEAILSLLMLYRMDPSQEWIRAAIRGLSWLAVTRNRSNKWEQDNWALMATEALYGLRRTDPGISFDDALISSHTVGSVKEDLKDQILDPSNPGFGSFGGSGETGMTSTRLEGLFAALSLIKPDEPGLRRDMEYAIRAGLLFLLRAQINDGAAQGAIPARSREYQSLEHPDTTEVRIDLIQHVLCCFLRELGNEQAATNSPSGAQ